VLIQAGNAARFTGDSAEAERYYAEAEKVRPDSWIPPYNLACLQAIDGHPDPAMASLDEAVERGFANPALLDGNEDFASLRDRPQWKALLARVAAVARDKAGRHTSPAAS